MQQLQTINISTSNLKLIIWGLFEHEIFHHYYKTHNNLHSQNLNLNLIPAIFKLNEEGFFLGC